MNGDVEIVDGHPILDVAIESIRLLDENRATRRIACELQGHAQGYPRTAITSTETKRTEFLVGTGSGK
jgi:hypothetical protein